MIISSVLGNLNAAPSSEHTPSGHEGNVRFEAFAERQDERVDLQNANLLRKERYLTKPCELSYDLASKSPAILTRLHDVRLLQILLYILLYVLRP